MKTQTVKTQKSFKGLKVWSLQEPKSRKGLAVKDYLELLKKIKTKFSEEILGEFYLFLEDGTEIDDQEYFDSLENQTIIYLSTNPKFIQKENPLEEFLKNIRWQNGTQEVVEQIRDLLFQSQDSSKKWMQMNSYVKQKVVDKTQLSSKIEDPQWFQDLSTNAKTKEEYLTKSCQQRIRGYLNKAEMSLKLEKLPKFQDIMTDFKQLLKSNRYNGHYFDRKSKKSDTICDENGLFSCEGRFDDSNCKYQLAQLAHLINPYESNEARILFSTWNLDHVIERSRTIVPTIIQAVKKCPRNQDINLEYFYKLLFTRDNLKLVHIICHDKQEHLSAKCDNSLIYKNRKKRKLLK